LYISLYRRALKIFGPEVEAALEELGLSEYESDSSLESFIDSFKDEAVTAKYGKLRSHLMLNPLISKLKRSDKRARIRLGKALRIKSTEQVQTNEKPVISYNLGITNRVMVLYPRSMLS